MNLLLRFVPHGVGALLIVSFAAAVLVASPARAQQQPVPLQPGQVVVVEVTTPPAGYAPVQVIEMPNYGGGYAEQQGPSLRIGMLQQELASVQAQYSQYSLGGSIALVSIGGAVLLISSAVLFLYGVADALGASDAGRGMLISGLFAAGGAALLVGGLVMMFSRISERRPYGLRIKEIKRELQSYGVRASMDIVPVPSGAVLTGTFSF